MIDQQQGQPRLNVGSQAPTGAPRRVAGSRQCTAMHNRVRDLKDTMNSLDLDDLSAPGGGLSWSDYIFSWKYDPIDIAIGEQIRTPSRDPLSPRQFQDGRLGIARTEFRATASPRCEFAKPGMEAPWVAGPRVWFAQVPMRLPSESLVSDAGNQSAPGDRRRQIRCGSASRGKRLLQVKARILESDFYFSRPGISISIFYILPSCSRGERCSNSFRCPVPASSTGEGGALV
jgi:hypothetical protein